MNIVLEGPDGAGKSTLASLLSERLNMRVQQGSGPPKAPGEIERRAREYLAMDGVIFDRHPCVSQIVYGALRGEDPSDEFMALAESIDKTRHVMVYCRAVTVDNHVVKPGENPAHIETVNKRYDDLVTMYDEWAMTEATVFYRIGDDVDRLADMLAAVMP